MFVPYEMQSIESLPRRKELAGLERIMAGDIPGFFIRHAGRRMGSTRSTPTVLQQANVMLKNAGLNRASFDERLSEHKRTRYPEKNVVEAMPLVDDGLFNDSFFHVDYPKTGRQAKVIGINAHYTSQGRYKVLMAKSLYSNDVMMRIFEPDVRPHHEALTAGEVDDELFEPVVYAGEAGPTDLLYFKTQGDHPYGHFFESQEFPRVSGIINAYKPVEQ